MKILIADVEGFIEFHVAQELLKFHGAKIFGLDNLNNYADMNLQSLNLKSKKKYPNIQKGDVKDTLSSNQKIRKTLKIKKFTPFKKGILKFTILFKKFYDL